MAEAIATCKVEGGPDYNVFLKGEASLISYELPSKEVNLGRIVCIFKQ